MAGTLIAREKHLLANQLFPSSETLFPLCSFSKEKKKKVQEKKRKEKEEKGNTEGFNLSLKSHSLI